MAADLMDAPRCTAKSKQSGERCKRRPVPGATVCSMHGGKIPAVAAAAKRRLMTQQVKAEAQAVLAHEGLVGVDDPIELLTRLAAEITAFKDALAARVNALTDIRYQGAAGEQLRAEVQLYERALDRALKVCEVLAKLDLEGKRQAAAERYGAEIAALLQAIFVELALSEQQWERVPVVVSHHLEHVGQLGTGGKP
jgi:hypothetical protein